MEDLFRLPVKLTADGGWYLVVALTSRNYTKAYCGLTEPGDVRREYGVRWENPAPDAMDHVAR